MASCPPIARHVREREMLDTSRRVVLSILASQSGSARGQGRSEEERNRQAEATTRIAHANSPRALRRAAPLISVSCIPGGIGTLSAASDRCPSISVY